VSSTSSPRPGRSPARFGGWDWPARGEPHDQQLERAIGIALFDRTPTGIQLTGAGIQPRDHVRPALDALDAGVRAVRETARGAGVVAPAVAAGLADVDDPASCSPPS
jgi:hypothetical protein